MSLLSWIKGRRASSKADENSVIISAIMADKVTNATQRLVKGTGPTDHLMSVDGSGAPVDFEWGPGAGEIVTVNSIGGVLIDEGVMAPNVFGSLLAALPNGILVLSKIDGIERQIALIVDNVCFALCFFDGNLGFAGGAGLDGFFDTNDAASSKRSFPYPLTLNGDNGDKIIARVQDDLSTVDVLRMQANITQIIKEI